jgi:hypothetical protein
MILQSAACGDGKAADRMNKVEREDLPRIQALAEPIIHAIEAYYQQNRRYPESVSNLIPQFLGRASEPGWATNLPDYDPFLYSTEGPYRPYHLRTCRKFSRWLFGKAACVYYPIGTSLQGDPVCTGENALGVDRRVGKWCITYGDTPPT